MYSVAYIFMMVSMSKQISDQLFEQYSISGKFLSNWLSIITAKKLIREILLGALMLIRVYTLLNNIMTSQMLLVMGMPMRMFMSWQQNIKLIATGQRCVVEIMPSVDPEELKQAAEKNMMGYRNIDVLESVMNHFVIMKQPDVQPGDMINFKTSDEKTHEGRILNVKEGFSVATKWKYGSGYVKEL